MLSPRHASVSRKFPEQGCEIFGIDARPGRIHYKVMKPFSWAFCLLPVHIYVSDSLQGNETFSWAFCLLPVHIYVSTAIAFLARISLVRFRFGS